MVSFFEVNEVSKAITGRDIGMSGDEFRIMLKCYEWDPDADYQDGAISRNQLEAIKKASDETYFSKGL